MKTLLAIALVLLGSNTVGAHPVAQGQLDVQWQQHAVLIRARVANEQIMVASALVSRADAATLTQLWQDHGRYLLARLQVHADGQLLSGTVLDMARSGSEFVEYRLHYPLATAVRELRLQQDLLNEIEYAPGNPWEAAYVVTAPGADGAQQTLLLRSRNQELRVFRAHATDAGTLARQFLAHGFQHILAGYDHLLFITALVLAAVSLRNLITVIATFTLAHSITLALSALQLIRLPAGLVEPVIAGSIVAVALSNILWPRSGGGWLRLATAFCFGLFHGLGFAGGLLEAAQAMSGQSLTTALVSFSVGVECGHLLVVVPLFFTLQAARRWFAADHHSMITLRGGSVLICLAGMFYFANALQW